jgi:hypothetical protein
MFLHLNWDILFTSLFVSGMQTFYQIRNFVVLETLLYDFFWAIPRRLNFICRRFGTRCLFHLHRRIGVEWLCLRNVGVTLLSTGSGHFRAKHVPFKYSYISTPIRLRRWNWQCSETSEYRISEVGYYHKKAYNIQNTAKVWNKEFLRAAYLISCVVKFEVSSPYNIHLTVFVSDVV